MTFFMHSFILVLLRLYFVFLSMALKLCYINLMLLYWGFYKIDQ